MKKWIHDNIAALTFLLVAAVHGFWFEDTYATILLIICSQLANITKKLDKK